MTRDEAQMLALLRAIADGEMAELARIEAELARLRAAMAAIRAPLPAIDEQDIAALGPPAERHERWRQVERRRLAIRLAAVAAEGQEARARLATALGRAEAFADVLAASTG